MLLRRFAMAAISLTTAMSAGHAADTVVYQEGKKFSEPAATVKVGETVTFTNKDLVTHNVFSNTPGMEFDLKQQKPGESTAINFDRVGEAAVQCAIHPKMQIKVTVQ